MKIDGNRTLVNLDAYLKSAQSTKVSGSSFKQGGGEVERKESVELSIRARELQKAREVIEATPEIRDDKVGRFKQEIEAGTYRISGDLIAEGMIRESLIDAFV